MPVSEAQKRASAKWISKNKERHNEMKQKWLDENRAHVNERVRNNNKKYYWRDKEFAIFRNILLEL
jgi:hypothetical protein